MSIAKKNIATILLLSLTLSACGSSSDNDTNNDTDTDETECTVDCETDTDTDTDTDTEETNLGAQILDTLTDDVGELRISLSDISTGTLSASVQLQEDANTTVVDDGVTSIKSTGYITLSNGGSEVAEIILSSGSVKYRDVEDEQITIEGLTYTEGDELDVYIEWDDQEYYLSLDGGDTLYGPYVGSAHDGTSNPVVDRLSFRLADTSSWSQHELNVDNIVVTDDGTEVLNESFSTDTYTVSDDLLTIYSSSGSEATVQEMDFADSSDNGDDGDDTDTGYTSTITDDFESYTDGTQISDASSDWSDANVDNVDTFAEISTAQANGGSNSLYIADGDSTTKPYAWRTFPSALTAASVEIDVYVDGASENITYLHLGDGKNSSNRFFEVRLDGNTIGYEDSSDNGDVTLDTELFTMDAWHTIGIEWTTDNLFTISVDGTIVAEDIDQTTLNTTGGTPSQLTLYTGDTSGNTNQAYFDNLIINY